jgi:hypothetical protein
MVAQVVSLAVLDVRHAWKCLNLWVSRLRRSWILHRA